MKIPAFFKLEKGYISGSDQWIFKFKPTTEISDHGLIAKSLIWPRSLVVSEELNHEKGGNSKIKAPSNFREKIEEKLEKWIFSQTLSRKSYLYPIVAC